MELDRNNSVGISDLNLRLSRLLPKFGEPRTCSFLSVRIPHRPSYGRSDKIDSVNISLPFNKEDMGDRDQPWPHVDQSPNRRFKHCVQGIMNLVRPSLSPMTRNVLIGSTRTALTMED